MRNRQRLVSCGLAAAVAVVSTATGLGVTSAVASPQPHHWAAAAACVPVPLWANTGGGSDRLIEYNPLTGAELQNVPVARDYGDIAFSADGTTLYGVTFSGAPRLVVINTGTGAETSTVAVSGPAASPGALNALTSLSNGMLLAATSRSGNLYTIDPATGVSTAFPAQFPPGITSAGDLTQLSDGDILALGATSTGTTVAFRIAPDNTLTEIGTLPRSFGVTQSGGQVYVFESGGNIDQLTSVPTAPSTAPLPFTVLAATGRPFFGAGSAQDSGQCNLQPGTSYSVAKASSPTGPVCPGERVTYTVTVKNTGTTPYFGDSAGFVDDLSKVLDHATVVGSPTASAGTATISGTTLTWAGPLDVGDTVTVTYTIRVRAHARGHLTNNVQPTAPGGSCATMGGCTTSTDVKRHGRWWAAK
ncbi:hypothetical protein ACGF12_27580 [Kitasatospora sp. NPDC048296]|uniref:DUF7927 domain-containing protein n=1 Tax=Kitasatospora sp. NPDC048296 TaxID=3364048 RepID=UPI00371D685E